MVLRLLIDEDCQSAEFVRGLRNAGVDFVTVAEERLNGADDETIFQRAQSLGRTILTRNTGDFLVLHRKFPDHRGLLLIYNESKRSRSATDQAMVRAVLNLQASVPSVAGQAMALNGWSFDL